MAYISIYDDDNMELLQQRIQICHLPFQLLALLFALLHRIVAENKELRSPPTPPLYLNVYSLLSLPFPCPSSLLLRIISFTIFPFQNTYTPYTSFDSSLPIREATIDPIKSKPLPPVFTFYPHRFHIVPYSCTLDHH